MKYPALALVALLAACPAGGRSSPGGATEPSARPTGEPADASTAARPVPEGAPAEQLVALFSYLASDLRAASQDCARQASAFARWTEAYADQYDALVLEAVSAELPPERTQELDHQLAEHIDAIIDAFDTNCDDHEPARAAFDRFETLILGG